MYNIYSDIENEIIDAINPIIDQYLQGRTVGTQHARNVISRKDYDSYFDGNKKTIFDAKKDFNKNKNLNQLLKDIKYIGQRNFVQLEGGDTPENELKYKGLVKKILNDIIKDRIAVEKDNKIMENIKSFDMFNESMYKKKYQKEIICPECGSDDADFLGPSDYIRSENGDYDRVMGYKCKKCGQTFDVLKKLIK